MATLVTATCGTDVVGWSPDGASAQQKVFELQHRARVSGTGWLPKGKALAVAGNDCVVNIYSMPDKKVAATVPKAISLPANPPTITALALSQANVLYGSSDGSINIAKLPDVKVRSRRSTFGPRTHSYRNHAFCPRTGQLFVSRRRPSNIRSCRDTTEQAGVSVQVSPYSVFTT